MEDETKDQVHVSALLVLLGSLIYCYILVKKTKKKIPKGILRLISLLPGFYLISILPWHFSSAFGRGISSSFITWIASFKLLLFSFDRGPLFLSHQNFKDFAFISIFPIKIKNNISPKTTSSILDNSNKIIPRNHTSNFHPLLFYNFGK